VVATDTFGQSATASTSVEAVTPTPGVINFKVLDDASASIQGVYGETSFNEASKLLYADFAIKNKGTYDIGAPLLVGVIHISDPSVHVQGNLGTTPDGIPYFDYTKLLDHGNPGDDQVLSPGETTEQTVLSFFDPHRVRFTFDLVVLGQLN